MEGTLITPARGFMAEHDHYHDDDGFWEAHADRLGGPVCDVGAAAGRISLRVAEGVCLEGRDADGTLAE